ncbi:hypothetical protein MVEN_00085400 [Mycena venus]|uniref:Uncharacterized protein n=1 Tax=Mycena venus TaxID=2733690 RepID=A0A8H6Z7Y3_9AGAR|nr:hypothetical protein MVEN_00085400 [Mycena venus]
MPSLEMAWPPKTESTLLVIVVGIYTLCFCLNILAAIVGVILGIRFSSFLSNWLTVALTLNELSFTIATVLAPFVIRASVTRNIKILRHAQILNAAHIGLGIAVGCLFFILLFGYRNILAGGLENLALTTMIVSWTLEIAGTLTMYQYRKVLKMRPKEIEISSPTLVAPTIPVRIVSNKARQSAVLQHWSRF